MLRGVARRVLCAVADFEDNLGASSRWLSKETASNPSRGLLLFLLLFQSPGLRRFIVIIDNRLLLINLVVLGLLLANVPFRSFYFHSRILDARLHLFVEGSYGFEEGLPPGD